MKHMERLRKMIGLAVKMDWLEKDPFAKYKFHFDKVERGHLSKDELNTLINKSFSIDRLQCVLDMFLFSCYTGLAYIDIFHLVNTKVSWLENPKFFLENREIQKLYLRIIFP